MRNGLLLVAFVFVAALVFAQGGDAGLCAGMNCAEGKTCDYSGVLGCAWCRPVTCEDGYVCPAGCECKFLGGPYCVGAGEDYMGECEGWCRVEDCQGGHWELCGQVNTCTNGAQDGDELGVDCGGSCVIENSDGEVFEEVCGDGIDNDMDCFVDCADPDCNNPNDPENISPECGCTLYSGPGGAGKLNVVVIGEYWDFSAAEREGKFKADVERIVSTFGSTPPFQQNIGKISFWMTLKNDTMTESQARARCPWGSRYVFLSLTKGESFAEIGGKNAYIDMTDADTYDAFENYTMHEIGHTFGLWDEYVDPFFDDAAFPMVVIGERKHVFNYADTNCFRPDLITGLGNLQDECRWHFGGIVQAGGMWPEACMQGCTSPSWYRSTECTVMREEWAGCGMYNQVGERIISGKLAEYG